MAFFYIGANVGEPWIVSSSFIDEKMNTLEFPRSVFITTESRDKKSLESICKEINLNTNFAQDDYRMFNSEKNNKDIVVKYMFLYQILLYRHRNHKGEESQRSVDDFIKLKFDLNKHMYQKWSDSYKGSQETIYTRLRNYIGPYREKTPIETRRAMHEKIDELIELVKMSIHDGSRHLSC